MQIKYPLMKHIAYQRGIKRETYYWTWVGLIVQYGDNITCMKNSCSCVKGQYVPIMRNFENLYSRALCSKTSKRSLEI